MGRVLRIDEATLQCTDTSKARACVEVDVLKQLPSKVWVKQGSRGELKDYKVIYENLPQFCTICRKARHSVESCNRNKPRKPVEQAKPAAVDKGKKLETIPNPTRVWKQVKQGRLIDIQEPKEQTEQPRQEAERNQESEEDPKAVLTRPTEQYKALA